MRTKAIGNARDTVLVDGFQQGRDLKEHPYGLGARDEPRYFPPHGDLQDLNQLRV